VRRESARSLGLRARAVGARRHRAARMPRACAARREGRTDHGAARRVTTPAHLYPVGHGRTMPAMASRDDMLALIERRRAAWSARDAAALAATHAEKGVAISPAGGGLGGRAGVERVYRIWFSAFTNLRFRDEDVLVDG